MSYLDEIEAKRRAQWLHDHKAPSDWVVLTKAEVAALRTDLERVTRERDEAKGPSFVEDPSSTADTGERIALNAAMLRLFKGQYRDPGDRHSDALFVQDGLVVTQEEVDRLRATIARLTADLAEARKDGERLDWWFTVNADARMESAANGFSGPMDYRVVFYNTLGAITQTTSWFSSPRAAIDAARDAGKGAKP